MADVDTIETINTDALLEQLGGCGRFQVCLLSVFTAMSVPTLFSMMIMSFGMYNPGWRCLDNVTSISTNYDEDTNSDYVNMTRFKQTNQTLQAYRRDTCEGFDTCQHIEFSPEASTIVTEWGLACTRSWIVSTILSVQMAGSLLSLIFSGYVGDRYGRKVALYIGMLSQVVFNLVSIFSVSWQMYSVTLFLVGFSTSFQFLGYVLSTEYVISSWRIRVRSIPNWTIISILFAVSAMLSKNWQILAAIAAVSGAVTCIPLLWIPESMRWLSVRGKEGKFQKVINKISRINNVEMPQGSSFSSMVPNNSERPKEAKSYTMFHLFRTGYRRISILIGLLTFLSNITWYVISFGVSAMPGNIYTNMILFAVCDLPSNIICYFLANKFDRKPTILSCYISESICLFGVVGVDRLVTGEAKVIGVLVLVLLTKVIQLLIWMVMSTFVFELYPTIVRGTVMSYVAIVSTIGGVIAPYMIPTNPDLFYIFYLVMAVMLIVCSVLLLLLPETKGKPLKDMW